MPKDKKKETNIKKSSSKMIKKPGRKKFNKTICEEDETIGIEDPLSDLTKEKKSKATKIKSKKVVQKSPNKKNVKIETWSDDNSIKDSLDSDCSDDWFKEFYAGEQEENTQEDSKTVTKEKDEVKKDTAPDKPTTKNKLKSADVRKSVSWTYDEENGKDPLDSDTSDDSFEKYFPETKEKTKPKTGRRKIIRLDYSMVQHLEGYEVQSRIFCSICNDHFNQMPGHPQNYTDHIIQVHAKPVGDDLYLCTFCNNTAPKTLKNLKMHLFRHRAMAKPKICTACGESFTDYNKWRCHMRWERSIIGNHPDKRIFPCDKCGKVCATNHSLQMHVINIHEKKGRKCRWCPRIVPYEEWEEHKEMEKIKNNVRTKTDCEICGATFTSKDSAANHRRNFHRNIVLECPICHKTFNSSTGLSQHRTLNHTEKRFQCAYCHYRNAYRFEVKKHISKKHKMNKDEIPDEAVIEHKPSAIPEFREPPVKKAKQETQNFYSDF